MRDMIKIKYQLSSGTYEAWHESIQSAAAAHREVTFVDCKKMGPTACGYLFAISDDGQEEMPIGYIWHRGTHLYQATSQAGLLAEQQGEAR